MQVGNQKFVKTKFDALDGKTVVAYTTEDSAFAIKASKAGVSFQGELTIEDQSELQQFAKLLSDAWTDHRKLVPKLSTTLSGH